MGVGQALCVADGQVLHAPVGTVDQVWQLLPLRNQIAISKASRARSADKVLATRQPTISRENTSVTKAT